MSDGAAMSKFSVSTDVNIEEHNVYGNNYTEVQIVSMNNRRMNIEIPIRKEDLDEGIAVEDAIGNLQGLIDRMAPLHIRSDEVPMFGNSHDVFVYVNSMNVDWQAGTAADSLIANVKLNCGLLGTPKNLNAKICARSQMRDGDYATTLARRSVIGLPYFSPGFDPAINVQGSFSRGGTTMLDLSAQGGFADDSVGIGAFHGDAGEVVFSLDVEDMNYLKNSNLVYDLGVSPKLRVYDNYHDFTGSCEIIAGMTKLVIDKDNQKIQVWFLADDTETLNAAWTGKHRCNFLVNFDSYTIVMNKDEITRIKFDNGDYLEVERGKAPVYHPADPFNGILFQIISPSDYAGDGSTNETPGSEKNYVHLYEDSGPTHDWSSWGMASNYGFDFVTEGSNYRWQSKYTPISGIDDQVFSIIPMKNSTDDEFAREVLTEIS